MCGQAVQALFILPKIRKWPGAIQSAPSPKRVRNRVFCLEKIAAEDLAIGSVEIPAIDVEVPGAVLAEEKGVNADLAAFSGTPAIEAEKRGQGQKVRIQARVSQVVRRWLGGA